MFNGLLQRKITVFREATLFAKALMSARIRQRAVYRNSPNNDTMFNGLLQRKITVFREATLFAKALMSARIRQRCCYVSVRPT
jgi:hypothetical protein